MTPGRCRQPLQLPLPRVATASARPPSASLTSVSCLTGTLPPGGGTQASCGAGRGRGAPRSGCRAPATLVPWPARPRPPLGPRGACGAALCRGRGRRLEGSRVLACPQGASQERAPHPAVPASPRSPSVPLGRSDSCLAGVSAHEPVWGPLRGPRGSPGGRGESWPAPPVLRVLQGRPPQPPRPGPLCPFSCDREKSRLTTSGTARRDLGSGCLTTRTCVPLGGPGARGSGHGDWEGGCWVLGPRSMPG